MIDDHSLFSFKNSEFFFQYKTKLLTYFSIQCFHSFLILVLLLSPLILLLRLELPACLSEFLAETHECGVCNESFGVAQSIELPTCSHSFCRECLRTFTKTRITEGRYPIFCPVCAVERSRVNNSRKSYF